MGNTMNSKGSKKKSSSGLNSYADSRTYSSSTYELRSLFKNECIIIPYTMYYQKIKENLPEKYRKVIEEYKNLTYSINAYKRNTSKCYNKDLVSYLKKLYKYHDEPKKLKNELYTKVGSEYVPKSQYKTFLEPTSKDIDMYKKYIEKGWKNHPVYIGAKQYYADLAKRKTLKNIYTALDERILQQCKKLWIKNYDENHKHINTKARDEFWKLARGLVVNTINQLYTIDIPENIPDIVDETLGRIYEGLMCFFDSNYKIDTFIYSVTMSKVSAYERARSKKEDAPELFHNMDDVESIHDYYGFFNPKLKPIIAQNRNLFVERHQSWINMLREMELNNE